MEELTVKILVCDDQNPELIIEAVEKAGISEPVLDLTALKANDLEYEFSKLFDRAQKFFGGDNVGETDTRFDDCDLILLDFGLAALRRFPHRLTAEHVAGYLRALTKAGYVVSLNKLPSVDFDLKYLLGDFDTKADMALNAKHLSLKGIWDGKPSKDEFCPWYWPRLNEAANRRKSQQGIVRKNIDEPILKTLDFPEQAMERLSLQAVAYLYPFIGNSELGGRKELREVTFWDHFCYSNRTLGRADRFALLGVDSESAFPPEAVKDSNICEIAARVVAGELDFWFRRDILGPQRLLIDAPHLQMKYRFRPGVEGELNLEEWSRTATESQEPFGLDPEFFSTLRSCEFKQSDNDRDLIWTGKPCFWHPKIEETDDFLSLAKKEQRRRNEIAFCEDTRRFVDKKSAWRFETEIGRGIDIRYVEKIEDYSYSPASQLAW